MQRNGCYLTVAILLLWLWIPVIQAQTVRPVIVEYRGSGQNRFELVNNSDRPLSVTIEPKSFTIDEEGNPQFVPLDPSIHLKLSGMSFRIPPQQSRFVFYQVSADKLPALVRHIQHLRSISDCRA
jgi:hypothetical protein